MKPSIILICATAVIVAAIASVTIITVMVVANKPTVVPFEPPEVPPVEYPRIENPQVGNTARPEVATAPVMLKVGDYHISGPYVHKNLAVYVVQGKDTITGKKLMTLDEALEKKLVIVHETGDVRELSAENVSIDIYVYIPSGTIVKGGKQDRTIRFDILLPPVSGKVPIESFCVEHGRWSRRGDEPVACFSSARAGLATKGLKMAAKHSASQEAVWDQVAKTQEDASGVAACVAPESPTSLQLTLENPKLREAAADYVKALSEAFADKKDVIGYAIAINGEINTVDIYGSSELFRKLLPRLLEASAIEALINPNPEKTVTAPGADAVSALILDADKGDERGLDLANGSKMTTKESDDAVLFSVYNKPENQPAFRYRQEIIKK